jgi:hypothetical protein
MPHELITGFNPLHAEEDLPSNLEVYLDTELDVYVIKDKETKVVIMEMPKDFPPINQS